MRIAVIDRGKCKADVCGLLCQRMCPRVRSGDETIIVDALLNKPLIQEDLCAGCGICVTKCPFGAIIITNTPKEAGVLTHQYGKNGFRLYGLPVPKEGSVVGIVGVNGIGKSTAIKILSGQLKPNLGRVDEETLEDAPVKCGKVGTAAKGAAWGEIIEGYRGNEVQNYLKKLSLGTLSAVYKPQYVDSLSKMGGTVKQMLSKVSKEWLPVAKDLGIDVVADREVASLSGGELQRLAIAVALLRDVELYFFDEPTSYLDISQRLKAAKMIRGLCEGGKSVIVVEHDLIVLDYLSDYVHIAFGEKSAFGILSKLKNTRVGINEYLAGWMRSENVRIRTHGIEFEVTGTQKFKSTDVLCDYPAIRKRYGGAAGGGGFELEVAGGKLYNGDVVGILGPNATGKTTMMRILVGEEKNDAGNAGLGLSISYKPQYLKPVGKTVREILQAVTKDLYKSNYRTDVLGPLELEGLLDRRADELSGGELQRVAIAECLSRDADIYFLDEPSAYLDVEQRLVAAKMIRRRMENEKRSAMVIDHDVGFVDYISDRLMVFSGEPSVRGVAGAPEELRSGMNSFLKGMDLTFRRDEETKRPRANKPGSQKDKEQRAKGEYYYM